MFSSPDCKTSPWWLWQRLIFIGAALLSYSPILHGGWLWDDPSLILQDERLRSLPGLCSIWLEMRGADYWPLTTTFFWIEWHLFSASSPGYHLFNLLPHLVNGFLVWRVLEKIGLRWGWLGGLIFLIHPLTVESVAWVSETKNTLSLLLVLLSFDAYLDSENSRVSYGLALVYFLLALLAKTSVVTLPLVLVLYHLWRKEKLDLRRIMSLAPFFLLSLLLGGLTYILQTAQPEWEIVQPKTFPERLVGAGAALSFYLGKFLWPVPLVPVYPHWPSSVFTLTLISSLGLWLGLVIILVFSRAGWVRHLFFGLGFFCLNLLPLLGLVHFAYERISPVADHFIYLPMIGLIGLSVAAMERLHGLVAPVRTWLVPGLIMGLLFLLGSMTFHYTEVFSDERIFWTYTLGHNPDCKEADNQLGLMALQDGRNQKALAYFKDALRINPTYALAHNNLGYLLEKQGRFSEARAEYAEAVKIEPHHGSAAGNLARLSNVETSTSEKK